MSRTVRITIGALVAILVILVAVAMLSGDPPSTNGVDPATLVAHLAG